MKPTRSVSRRSFLQSVGGAALAGGALCAVTGRANALQSGGRAGDAPVAPAGGKIGPPPVKPGDSDFAEPRLEGDVMRSDPPPARYSGLTDTDAGPALDSVGYGAGTGEARREAHAARCTGLRQRIDGLAETRPRSAEVENRIAALRPYLERWRCN